MPVKNLLKTHVYSDIIILPSSILEVELTLEMRTLLVSRIARILGAFQVDELLVYKSSKHRLFEEFCSIMEYLLTPPYLKKYVPKKKTLSKIGIAYPFNIAIHVVEKNPDRDPIRLGLIASKKKGKILVDVGIGAPLLLESNNREYSRGDIVLVDLEKKSILDSHNYYVGFRVKCFNTMNRLLHYVEGRRKEGYALIGTSVKGSDYRECRACDKYKRIIFYGDPRRGVDEMYKGVSFDDVINILTGQGTVTLRTEEALCISLSRLHK